MEMIESLQKAVVEKVDRLQYALSKLPQIDLPLVHRFTPGLYIRQITMPKGAIVVSRIHKTTHPFVVSKGKVSVWDAEKGVQKLEAPFTGITTPGTRRILYIHEETIWTTFHPTDLTDPDAIVAAVTEEHDVNYVGELEALTLKQLQEDKL